MDRKIANALGQVGFVVDGAREASPRVTAGEADETALRMRLRHGLAAAFNDPADMNGTRGWRWLGRVLGKGRQVPPADLTRPELERALAELEKLPGRGEARAA